MSFLQAFLHLTGCKQTTITVDPSAPLLIQQAYQVNNKLVDDEIVAQISLLNDIEDLRWLMPLIFYRNPRIAVACAEQVHRILQSSLTQLSTIEQIIRATDFGTLLLISPARLLKKLALTGELKNSVFALLTFHRDGYIRADALNRMSHEYPEVSVPIFIVRANDWVESIKKTAVAQLMLIIQYNLSRGFFTDLSLLEQLLGKKRYNHANIISIIEHSLARYHYSELLASIQSNQTISRRVALKIACSESSRIPELMHIVKKSNDGNLKLFFIRVVATELFGSQLFDFLTYFLNDRSAVVRKECLYILLREFKEQSQPILLDTLFDSSQTLRQIARYYLRDTAVDSAEFYREALRKRTHSKVIAMRGLAETGKADDFNLIAPFANDAELAVKKAYIYALVKLNPENKQSMLIAKLPNTNKEICDLVVYAITQQSGYDFDAIEQLYSESNDLNVQYALVKMKLKIATDHWGTLKTLIEFLVQSPTPVMTQCLKNKLLSWLAQSAGYVFTVPSVEETERLKGQVAGLMQGEPGEGIYQQVNHCLGVLHRT